MLRSIALTFLFVIAATNISAANTAGEASFTGAKQLLIGRFDRREAGSARFTWPDSALEFRFTGTGATIAISSNDKARFAVDIDGKVSDLWVDKGNASYTLASGLPSSEHTLRLTRLAESFSTLTGFTSDPSIEGGSLLPAPAAAQRHLLFIGDSITAGYGDEGASKECHYTQDSSNPLLTYAALAAKNLDADHQLIAWSGIGAWRSYGETTPKNPNILTRYQRTLADDPSSHWDSSRYTPDAIVINIGTNDYWNGDPGAEYRRAMQALIAQVQKDYPGKPVFLIVSPMLTNENRASQASVLASLASDKVKVLDLGKIEASEGYGCDYHPNTATHARLGKALTQDLKKDLNW